MNDYFRKVCHIKHYMKNCLKEVFGSYQNELLLNLEDQNLLESPQNSLESATAMGYLLEEFVISKLEKMTKKYKNFEDEIKIQRKSKKQKGHRSYDCFANFNNILFLINIKVQKKVQIIMLLQQ